MSAWKWTIALAIGMAAPACAQQPASKGFAGVWTGTLTVGAAKLRLVAHLVSRPDGGYTATLDSPDQGASGIPLDQVSISNDKVVIGSSAINGKFEGTPNAARTTLEGNWTQNGASFPLTLTRADKAPELRRPQEPKPPYPYQSEDVSCDNRPAGAMLAGTLTYPHGAGPFPAVVLIAGSGPNTRNEEVFGHKVFLVLADYLTRRGIAVLRADKRGVGKSTGDYSKATSNDFADDVLAWLGYLKTRKEIDPARIGLLGHSEGGLVAPLVASRSSDVHFVVLMAGPGMNGEQILYRQGELITRAAGMDEAAVARERATQETMFHIVRAESDPTAAAAKLIDALMKNVPEAQRNDPHVSEGIKGEVARVNSPWFRNFLTYDPLPALRKVRCPVLAMNGSKDLQVPPREDLAAIEAALKEGGNKDVTIKELPGLNHLFQTAKTGAVSEYGQIEETISPVALQTIGDWITAHTKA